MPDGKLLYTNGQYYTNIGYLPNYTNIQYQQPTLIVRSTTIPAYNTDITVSLPQSLLNYPRFIIIISMRLQPGSYRTDLNNLQISNIGIYLHDSNDRMYADFTGYWWGICFKTNTNIGCVTTQKSTGTGSTVTIPSDNFITISQTVSVTTMELFNIDFVIF